MTTGVYAHVRHPIYIAGGVVIVGVLTFIGQPVLYVIVPVLAWKQMRRARREERVLEAAFGDAYREYRARTWP